MFVDGKHQANEFSAVLFGLGLLLVGAATLALSFIAVSAYRLDVVVSTSLPCEPGVITDPGDMIDLSAEHVATDTLAANRAHDACMTASKELFKAEGVEGAATTIYWPLIWLVDMGAVALLAVGWLSAGVSNMSKKHSVPLLALTAIMAMAGSAQAYFADTIDIVSWIVD